MVEITTWQLAALLFFMVSETCLVIFSFRTTRLWRDARYSLKSAADETDKALAREAEALEKLTQAHARLRAVGTMAAVLGTWKGKGSVSGLRELLSCVCEHIPAGADPSQGEIAEILAEYGLKWIGKED